MSSHQPAGDSMMAVSETLSRILNHGHLWRDEDGIGHITWENTMFEDPSHSRWESMPLRSSEFHSLLQMVHTRHNEEGLTERARQDIITKLQGDAAVTRRVDRNWMRSAWHHRNYNQSDYFLDMSNDSREMVKLSWDPKKDIEIINDCYPKFRRVPGQQPMKRPAGYESCGEAWEQFCDLFGFEDVDQMRLIYAWMMYALWPDGPYPLLSINGGPDSGKSTLMKAVRRLVDPCKPESTGLPATEKDLIVHATQSRVLALDNLSSVPSWCSDALCRISTGTGTHVKKLYTETEHITMSASCAVVVTGINHVIRAPDLLSRAVVVNLKSVAHRRLSETVFWRKFDDIAEYILGQLLQGIRHYLIRKGSNTLADYQFQPRMHTFSDLAQMSEMVFGWEKGVFVRAYQANLDAGHNLVVDESPSIAALIRVAEGGFMGTVSDLMEAISGFGHRKDKVSEFWPQSTVALGRLVNSSVEVLAKAGIESNQRRIGHKRVRIYTLEKRKP